MNQESHNLRTNTAFHYQLKRIRDRANRVREFCDTNANWQDETSDNEQPSESPDNQRRGSQVSVMSELVADAEEDVVRCHIRFVDWFTSPKQSLTNAGKTFNAFIKGTINSEDDLYVLWLSLVTITLLYNAIMVPLKCSFPYVTPNNKWIMDLMEYACDLVYLIDLALFQPKLQFIHNGFLKTSRGECAVSYLRSVQFKTDLLALLPLDLILGIPFARIIRVFKFRCYTELYTYLESVVSYPVTFRLSRTLSTMLYMIHCNACLYYIISEKEHFGLVRHFDSTTGQWVRNPWPYQNEADNAYVHCFYFATKISITIGNNSPPGNVLEYLYMFASWLTGIFVFALLLGQIHDIITNANRNQEQFRKAMDDILLFCHSMKVPKTTQDRVRSWFTHTWQSQKMLDKMDCRNAYPVQELLHKCFMLAYRRCVTEQLQRQAYHSCPTGCNYIDPLTLDFVYEPGASTNFGGYTAYLKFGDPQVNVHGYAMMYEWRCTVEQYMELKMSDLFDYMMRLTSPLNTFRADVIPMLIELD